MKCRKVRKVLGLAAAVGIACGSAAVSDARPAAAGPVSLTLRYTCSVKSIEVPLTVRLDADVPASASVGEPTPRFDIHATVPLSAAETKRLDEIGIRTVEGTADARIRVVAPGDSHGVRVLFSVARTRLPSSGPVTVEATGVAPAFRFSRPGTARITVGDLDAHITVEGDFLNGSIHVPCGLQAGRATVVASVPVTGPGTASGTGGSGAPGAAGSGTAVPTAAQGAGDRGDGTTGSNGPSGRLATAGGQGTGALVPLAAGAVLLGTLATAAALRFRSRGRRPGRSGA